MNWLVCKHNWKKWPDRPGWFYCPDCPAYYVDITNEPRPDLVHPFTD